MLPGRKQARPEPALWIGFDGKSKVLERESQSVAHAPGPCAIRPRSPPLPHAVNFHHACCGTDDQSVVAAASTGRAWVWSLAQAAHRIDDLRMLAALLTGERKLTVPSNVAQNQPLPQTTGVNPCSSTTPNGP